MLARHVHPNIVTVFAFTLGLISCGFILAGRFYTALVFGVLNRIVDGMDGTIARLAGKQSDFGGYLDIMLDFILYTLVPLAFAYRLAPIFPDKPLYAATAVLLGSFYINSGSWAILSAILEKRKSQARAPKLTSVNMPGGLVEGVETMLFYALFFILPGHLVLLFLLMAGLTLIGAVQRFIWAARKL